jgi:predicted Zn-dependent peptidase
MKHWAGVVALVASACGAGGAPLPAAPPRKSLVELQAWLRPPTLQSEAHVELSWNTQRVQLENGVGVTVVARPNTALTAVQLWVPSAGDRSEGAVAVMGDLLRAGTQATADSVLINPKLGNVPVAVWTGPTGSAFSWQVLARASRPAVELLAAFVLRPAFQEQEVPIRLKQVLAAIQRHSLSTDQVTLAASGAIPGFEAPRSKEDAQGALGMNRGMLREVHRCRMYPTGAELVIVGPVVAEHVVAWARAAFGSWQPKPSGADPGCDRWRHPFADSKAGQLERPLIQVIEAGYIEPKLALVVPGPAPESEEYLPFTLLMNVIQNREAGSVQKLRHMGATYGIRGSVNDRFRDGSLLELAGQIEAANVQKVLRSVVEDIRGLSNSLTEQELDLAKRYRRTEFVDAFASNAAVAEATLWQLSHGQPATRVQSWPDELMAVDLGKCQQVAARWLSSAQPSIAVAGRSVRIDAHLGLDARLVNLHWTTAAPD